MKRFFCMSLCVLMLFSSTAFAKKKCWKRARCCVPCAPCPPDKAHPCVCALFPAGTFWVGETHPAPGPGCGYPEPVYMPGINYSYGICQTNGCTGGGCENTSLPSPPPSAQPIIDEPQPHATTRLYDTMFHETNAYVPVFIEMYVDKKGRQVKIKAKVFFVEIDFKSIAHEFKLPPNSEFPDKRIILVGYECTDPPGAEPPYVPKRNNAREAIVEMNDPKGELKKAIVFLAP